MPKRITEEIAREMRRLYVDEGMEARDIDLRFGFSGSANVVRNRRWHDENYTPPLERPGGRKASVITIHGEGKTPREWSEDDRCQVSYETLRKRISEGIEGHMLLIRTSKAGRPRG